MEEAPRARRQNRGRMGWRLLPAWLIATALHVAAGFVLLEFVTLPGMPPPNESSVSLVFAPPQSSQDSATPSQAAVSSAAAPVAETPEAAAPEPTPPEDQAPEAEPPPTPVTPPVEPPPPQEAPAMPPLPVEPPVQEPLPVVPSPAPDPLPTQEPQPAVPTPLIEPPPPAPAPMPPAAAEKPPEPVPPPPKRTTKPEPAGPAKTVKRAKRELSQRPPEASAPERATTPDTAAANNTQSSASVPIAADWQRSLASWLAEHRTYPEAARRRGTEGGVVVRFTADRSGRVLSVDVVRGSGSSLLDDAAEALLRNASLPPFTPGMAQEKVTVTVQIRYQLTN